MAIPAMLLLLPLSQLSTAELSYSYSSSNTPTATKSEFSPVVADGILEISNDEFYPWLSEIYSNIDTYVGNEIKMTGFVYKASENDKFILVRLGMSCCVADLVPYGLMCTYSNAEELNPDDWIVISGTLQKNENGEPLISIKSVTPTDPVEGYVYTI
jgi:putative membrane protein